MEKINKKNRKLEVLLWSVALPGFGQILNRKYVKGILFVGLEFLVNVKGNINQVIMLSFRGDIHDAIAQTDYLWIMFYPCLYYFAIWDAYRDAGEERAPFAYLPLVVSAYIVTIGLTLSPFFRVFGYLIGPIWISILFTPIGLGIGWFIKWLLLKYNSIDSY